MEDVLRELIRNILIESSATLEYPSEFVDAINKYVSDSRVTSYAQKKIIIDWVDNSSLPRGLVLQRVSSSDPEYEVGDTVNFPLASFTTADLTTGKSAGHIAWKSSDKCLMMIENPVKGWKVDYNIIKVFFDASSEKEVIVTGNYMVIEKRMITEPGTLPQYGYKIPLYVLQEL